MCFVLISFPFFGSLGEGEGRGKKSSIFPSATTISFPIMKLLPCAVRSQTFLYIVCHVKISPEVFLSKQDGIFAIRHIRQPNISLSFYFRLRTTELLSIGSR